MRIEAELWTGDIVRFGPDSLSFRTPGAVHDIYTDRKANVIKTGWTETSCVLSPSLTTQIMSDRVLHAARRKLLNQAFSASALKSMEQYVLQTVRTWCEYLQEPPSGETANSDGDKATEGWSKERDMAVGATLLTLDVLGELSFGASFGAIKQGHSYISGLLMGGSTMIAIVSGFTSAS